MTKTDAPQVAALLQAAEKRFGKPVKTPSDFDNLAHAAQDATNEYISESTVKRLWKPNLSYKTVSEQTLNTLAQYAGYPHFQAFCQMLAETGVIESDIFTGGVCIKSANLTPGDIVLIAWQPDRECKLKYLGDNRFEAVETANSKIQAGDTFSCTSFALGRKLFVDDFHHDGSVYDSYGMGLEHGLSRVVLNPATPSE